MPSTRSIALSPGVCLLALACALFLCSERAGAAPSDLSRWLGLELAPELIAVLSDHPRYRGRAVTVTNRGEDALGDAVVRVLRARLAEQSAITLRSPGMAAPVAVTYAIDELACVPPTGGELQVGVTVQESRSHPQHISFELLEHDAHGAGTRRLWNWTGTLTRAERGRARDRAAAPAADGSLDSPWTEADVEAAARALSRDLACRLRPQISSRLRLRWVDSEGLPALFRDTLNSSRHHLGVYRELLLADDPSDYLIDVELRPFRGDTYQLWLHARPRAPLRDPEHAVAYFRVPGLNLTAAAAQAGLAKQALPADARATARGQHVAARHRSAAERKPDGSSAWIEDRRRAADYLHVELLHARQKDRRPSGADLALALRVENRADRPIAFALRLSAGHFLQCLADPDYYRHDRYGTLRGILAPGASEIRKLVVKGLRHAPLPLFGTPRCAGSIDLEALENYAVEGERVTDYVHWDS